MDEKQDLPRFSINVWTPSRCLNAAVEDDHGKAFYGNSSTMSPNTGYTPRRSARIRKVTDYPRERSARRRKRNHSWRKRNNELFTVPSVNVVPCTPDRSNISDRTDDTPISSRAVQKEGVNILTTIEKKIAATKTSSPSARIGSSTKRLPGVKSSLAELFSSKYTNTPKSSVKTPIKKNASSPSGRIGSSAKKLAGVKSSLAELFSLKYTNTPTSSVKTPIDKNIAATKTSGPSDRIGSSTKKLPGVKSSVTTPSQAKQGSAKQTPSLSSRKLLTSNSKRPGVVGYLSSNKKDLDKLAAIIKPYSTKDSFETRQPFKFTTDYSAMTIINSTTPTGPKTTTTACRNSKSTPRSTTTMKPKRIEISKIPVFSRKKNPDMETPKVLEFHENGGSLAAKRENKVIERQQKNMALYKAGYIKTRRNEIIQGVRSNRRFELQMQYRNELLRN